MPGPLDGVRIVDVSRVMYGPFATMILADQGAALFARDRGAGGQHVDVPMIVHPSLSSGPMP